MGAAYLDMQASRGGKQADEQLSQTADRLRKLAGHVVNFKGKDQQQDREQKAQSDSKQLNQAFAKANCALASRPPADA